MGNLYTIIMWRIVKNFENSKQGDEVVQQTVYPAEVIRHRRVWFNIDANKYMNVYVYSHTYCIFISVCWEFLYLRIVVIVNYVGRAKQITNRPKSEACLIVFVLWSNQSKAFIIQR